MTTVAESYSAGRLLVAVVPDMRGSAAKIRKEFSGIGPFDVRVTAEVDDKAIKGLRAALKALPDVVVTADTSAADRDLAALRKRITALSDHEVGVSISADDARREIGEIRQDLDRLSDAGVTVDADTAAARSALGAVSEQLDRIHGRAARARVDLDTAGALSKVAAFQKRIGMIRDIRAALVYDVRIGPALTQIALLNAALLGIPAVVGASVYSVASLGAALAPTIGALALIPAAVGAAGIAFAALKVGTDGFGEAMKNLGDPEKFAQAIATLSPAARGAAVAIRDLRPAWTEVQQAVQQELFAGFTSRIRELAGLYLPLLRDGLTGTAGALNRFALNFAAFASAPQTLADVPVIFGNTNAALTNLSPVVNNVLGAFRDMAVVGSSFLPGLATGVVNATQRFQDFIHTARDTGQLAVWIQGGLDALAQLGRIVGNVGSAFGGLFRAANTAGANFLGTLETLTGTLATFLNSAEGQTALVTLFRNIQDLTTAMAPGIQTVLGMIGDLIVGLAPMLPQVGAAFSAVAGAVRPLLGLLISLVATVLPPLLDLIIRFPGVFIGLAIAVGVLVGAYRTLIAVSGVIKATQAALALIKTSTMLPAIWATVTALWAQAAAFMAAYWPVLLIIGVIALLVGAVIYAWHNFEGFRNVVLTVWGAIKTAFAAIGAAGMWLWHSVLVPAFQAIGAAAMWLWTNAIKPAFDFIGLAARVLFAVISTVLIAPLLIAWNLLSAAAMWLWENAIRPAFQAIGTFIGWVWTALIQPALAALVWFWQNVVAPAAAWLWNSVIKPTFQALGAFIAWVWTALIQPALAALVWFWQNVITPAALWLWNSVIKPTFQAIGAFIVWVWTGLIKPALDALVWFWNNVLAPAAMWLWQNVIKPAFEGIGAVIKWVWENVIRPAFDAVTGALDWLGQKFVDVTNWIRDIWNRIRGYLAKPINFMIDTVWNKGVVPAWNAVAKLVGLGEIKELGLIPEARTGGRVDSRGMIHGPGTGTSDSILGRVKENDAPLKVSNREFIVNERATRRHLPLLSALNGGARIGDRGNERRAGQIPGFAGGGMVWEGLWNTVKGQFPRARLGSAYRPGDSGHHGKGQAVDVAGSYPMAVSQMKEINHWIGNTFPGSTQLIHYPITGGGINLLNGGPHNYDVATQLGHGNHVHWAQDPANPRGGGNGAQNGWQQVSTYFMDAARGAFDKFTGGVIDGVRTMMGPPPPAWREVVPALATKMRDTVRDFVFGKASEKDAAASTVGMGATGADMPAIVKIISDVARSRFGGRAHQAAVTGTATGLVESNLTNIPGGDRDSVGVFQQRPSMGWGTIDQIMNVTYAAGKFFEKFPGNWSSWDQGKLAQHVQRSAFPAKYGQRMGEARVLVDRHGGFDQGGKAFGKGIMFKDVMAAERVLDPEATEDYDVLSDYRRMIDDGRLMPTRGLDARQLAAMSGDGPGGREMHLHVHGDVNDPMDVDSLYNQIDFRERSASL